MGKSNLLKEAIADAKAVRETALANARMRMEEAFTPRLQSMISAKLQNEIEGEGEEVVDDTEGEEGMPPEEPIAPEGEEAPVEEPVAAPEGEEAPIEEPVEEPVDIDVNEPEGGDDVDIEVEPSIDGEEGFEGEDTDETDENFDLESIIRELENDSMNDEEDMQEPTFNEGEDEEHEEGHEGEEDEEGEKEFNFNLEESELIDPKQKSTSDVTAKLSGSELKAGGKEQTSPDRGKPFSTEKGGEHTVSSDLNKLSKNKIYEEENDEEINLDEILRELEEEDVSKSMNPEMYPKESDPFQSAGINEQLKVKVSSLTKDLKEHRNVIKFLKSKLNEVNLLNAKLLFTSKLFKSNNMNNAEKMKVIESFDRAKTLREVKLVYSTIAESVNVKPSSSSKAVTKKITESIGGASKPAASIKPVVKKIISEGIVSAEGADRLRKLAGIKIVKK